jgi:hypothetical protein
MFGLKAFGVLRISEAEELEGLDIAEHGAPAYHPEYAYMGYSPLPASIEESGGAGGVVAAPSDIHVPAVEQERSLEEALGAVRRLRATGRSRVRSTPPRLAAGFRVQEPLRVQRSLSSR